MQKAAVIALGCPKNTVEAEYLLGMLHDRGYGICADPADADIAIIHTCSFIHDARKESEECVKNVLSLKASRDIKVYVSGCLPQLLQNKTAKMFPEIDGFVGTGALADLPDFISGKKPASPFKKGGLNDSKYRILSSPLPYAYLKIAEGCGHKCSFCIIPSLRGKYESRSIESLVEEASVLADSGIKELIIVAQDTSAFGKDIYNKYVLDKLLTDLSKVKKLKWIRLMYAYPSSITDELIDVIKKHSNICKYIDMPVQHASGKVLADMKRPSNTRKIVEKIKNRAPEIVLRTSFITGFPGESKKDFTELLGFVKEGFFQYAGFFEYSDQKNAASSKLSGKVAHKTARQRRIELEKAQYVVFKSKIEKLKDNFFGFLVENCVKHSKKYLISGRFEFQAPGIDGGAYAFSAKPVPAGKLCKAAVKGVDGYNIKAEMKI